MQLGFSQKAVKSQFHIVSYKQSQLSYCINTEVLTCACADLLGANWVKMCVLAADSFDYKKFFKASGLAAKTADDVKNAFKIIDQDNSGFIEEEELK